MPRDGASGRRLRAFGVWRATSVPWYISGPWTTGRRSTLAPGGSGDETLDALVQRLTAFLEGRISPDRIRHSVGTWEAAVRMVARFGLMVDERALAHAALLHDCAREMKAREMAALAGDGDLPPAANRRGLLHGPAGAMLVRRELGVEDESVLEAIGHHTTGRAGGGVLLSLVLAGDYLEAGRPFHAGREALDGPDGLLARSSSLPDLCLAVMRNKLSWCLQRGRWVAPSSVEAYNWYLEVAP